MPHKYKICTAECKEIKPYLTSIRVMATSNVVAYRKIHAGPNKAALPAQEHIRQILADVDLVFIQMFKM